MTFVFYGFFCLLSCNVLVICTMKLILRFKKYTQNIQNLKCFKLKNVIIQAAFKLKNKICWILTTLTTVTILDNAYLKFI